MAHLGSSYTSLDEFLATASNYWAVDFVALNSSGVSGQAVLALGEATDGTPYLSVSITADGMTANQVHVQHIHGTFDAEGNPTDAREPVLAQDTDGDGFVEVLEGVATYGDIVMTLDTEGHDHGMGHVSHGPSANAAGELSYVRALDLTDLSALLSPVSGNQYTMEDLMPLVLREIVLHGASVGAGYGAGSTGEINGSQNGYVAILPAATGEIEAISKDDAWAIFEDQFEFSSEMLTFGAGRQGVDAGLGNDTILGYGGRDSLMGGADDDLLNGGKGADLLDGGEHDDRITGGNGNDTMTGGDGADTFQYFGRKAGADLITDFDVTADLIDLSGANTSFARLTITELSDGDALVAFGQTTIRLDGVGADEIGADSFLF
ncbi:MAG TPA: hypothetical protein DEF16_09765 [Gemmobacter sp.]|nr:hypothetical protein [Gemmobacter sp.]